MKNLNFLIILLPLLLFMSAGNAESIKNSGKTLEQMVEDRDDILIIDVRTPQEYNHKHIKGAVNMPYHDIKNLIGDTPKYKQIVLYCRSGNRSGIAHITLKSLGYTKILDYKRFSDWKGAVEF